MINTNYFVDKDEFSKKLRELIDESGCKSIELENKLKVGRATISRWRNGHTIPNDSQIREIADFFGVRYKWLIGKDNEFKTVEEQRKYYFPNGKIKIRKEKDYHHWVEFFGYRISYNSGNSYIYDEETKEYILSVDDDTEVILHKNGKRLGVGLTYEEFEKVENEIESFIDYKLNTLFEKE